MMKAGIDNLEEEIKFIKNDIGLKGISYDGVSVSPTNQIKSSVEQTVISIQEVIHFKERDIERLKTNISKIERALDGLEERERIVLTEKYINNKQWWQVSGIVRYGERHCKRIRTEAINKMIIGLYG